MSSCIYQEPSPLNDLYSDLWSQNGPFTDETQFLFPTQQQMIDLSTVSLSESGLPPFSPLPGNSSPFPTAPLSPKSVAGELNEALDNFGDELKVLVKDPSINAAILRCSYSECSSLTFSRRCDLNKHNRRIHNRPHKCLALGCDSKGFSSLSELNRHVSAVHTSHYMFCPITGCNRSETAPVKKTFKRQDHLTEHMRRRHSGYKNSTTPSLSRSPSPGQHSLENSISYISTFQPSSGSKRRRRTSNDGEEHGQLIQRLRDTQAEIQNLKAENIRLRELKDSKLDELRARVKWLEDNNQLLTQVVDRMSKDKT